MKAKELTAAVKYEDGKIFIGIRHGLCRERARAEGYEGKKYIDGFVDTKEKFYTRFEAAEQLGLPKSTFLRSEDLPFFES